MKKTWMVLAVVALGAVLAAPGRAASFRPLLEQERAALGATHVLEISYADMATATTTNAAYTNSLVAVTTNQAVSVVCAVLDTAFDTANTNYTGSLALTVGDGGDADRFLTSMELASDGSEVFLKMGRVVSGAATTLNAWTNAAFNSHVITTVVGEVTSVYTVVGAPTGQVAAVYSGYTLSDHTYVYTAADTVDCIFTPNAEESPSENTSGKVRIYFRIVDRDTW